MLSCVILAGSIFLTDGNKLAHLDHAVFMKFHGGSLRLKTLGDASEYSFEVSNAQRATELPTLIDEVVAPCEHGGVWASPKFK